MKYDGTRLVLSAVLLTCFVFSIGMVWSASLWPDAVVQTALYTLVAVLAFCSLFRRVSLRSSWLLLPLTAVPVWGLVQLGFRLSTYRFATWESVIAFGSLAGAVILALFAFESERTMTLFRYGLILIGVAFGVLGLLQQALHSDRVYFIMDIPGGGFPMGPFVNRDHYSALIELLFPVAVSTAIQQRRTLFLCAPAAALMYASVVAGASRAGVLITTAGLVSILVVIFLKYSQAESRFPWKGVIVLVCLVLAFSAAVRWRVVLGRLAFKHPLAYRQDFWRTSLQIIKDRPLAGFGLGSWQWVYPRYAKVDFGAVVRHAHNDWLEWTCDGGIVVLAAFIMVGAYSVWLGCKYPWALGPAMVLAHSFVDFPLQNYSLLLGLVLILSAAESCRLIRDPTLPPIGNMRVLSGLSNSMD